jgi:DNA-binding NarL/FixJ family response regulator
MSKLCIMVAENYTTVREGIKLLIEAQPDMEVIGEAGDGLTTVSIARSLIPDVLVMGVSMPGASGLQATEQLNQLCPQVKVLVLTRHQDKAYLLALTRAGAHGYVLKQSPAGELLRAIRVVAQGGPYLDPALAGTMLDTYLAGQPKFGSTHQPWISKREAEVLRLIAWGYSNKEIAAEFKISVKTVEAHRANAMRKLGLHSRTDIVRFALVQGWLQES